MLVLFVLVVSIMQYQQNQLKLKLAEYEKIEEIKNAINNLNPKYFKYDAINKRHELRVNVLFSPGSPKIPNAIKHDLYKAGKELSEIINNLSVADNKIKYLVIIEGMAARYNDPSQKWKNSDPDYIERTYKLSYDRAKALFQFWQSKGIFFDENVFEIVLAGSGWYGAGRYKDGEEGNNKRFLIQIIPKVGEINPASYLRIENKLRSLPKLIPNNDNGKFVFTEIIVYPSSSTVIASYEDGHNWGSSKYKYHLSKEGVITFNLIDSYEN
ncbi:MAG: hypothetical protein CMP67_10265 [Flavobacteriales bacterium]|nr:hypothetical protein [Flavobacteriales bacterium]